MTVATQPPYIQRSIDAVTRECGTDLSGTTASRRVLAETGTTSAPSSNTDGFSVLGAEKLIVTLAATTAAYSVVLWEWDASSETWALNSVVGTQVVNPTPSASDTLRFGAEVDGMHRAYLQVTAGTGGTVSGWARIVERTKR